MTVAGYDVCVVLGKDQRDYNSDRIDKQMMGQAESQYQSYLLRLWRSSEGKAWRVMLQHIGSHERHGFADLEGLCAFLRTQTGRVDWSPETSAKVGDIFGGNSEQD